MEQIRIRFVTEQDIDALLSIYAPYVKDSAITFEYEVPSRNEFTQRIIAVGKHYPFLVAECANEVIGYAYYQAFHERAAYQHCAEISIYVNNSCRQKGIGKKLYQKLEDIAALQQLYHLYACIAYPPAKDEYLSEDSYLFHKHMGYQEVGRFSSCGCKFMHWYDVIWMDKVLSETYPQKPFQSIEILPKEALDKLGL